MTYDQLESFMCALGRGESYQQLLELYGVTGYEVEKAIEDEIADAERRKAEAIMRLIRHRQSKVQ